MFYGEKNILFLFTPWFSLLGHHRYQMVIKRPMILLPAIYTSLMPTFEFSICLFWAHSLGFMPRKQSKILLAIYSRLCPTVTSQCKPNRENDWKKFKKINLTQDVKTGKKKVLDLSLDKNAKFRSFSIPFRSLKQ